MGRWAEVYFTTPPEKRREAVEELLRELGANSKAGKAAVEDSSEQGEIPHQFMESRSPSQVVPLPVVCRQCGEQSPPSQKYCGTCGAVLPEGAPWPPSVIQASKFQTVRSASEEAPFAPYASSMLSAGLSASDDEEDFHSVAEDAPRFIPEYEPVHYRYRLYLGAGLAVLIGLLVFVAWRNNAASSEGTAEGGRHPVSLPALAPSTQPTASSSPQGSGVKATPAQSPPVASTPPDVGNQAAAPAPQSPARPQVSGRKQARPPQSPPVASTPPDVGNQAAAPAPQSPARPQVSGRKEAPPTQSPPVASTPPELGNRAATAPPRSPATPQLAANRTPLAENTEVPGTGGDGSDELAVAESYLNGRHGASRDSTEAVRWLWRSVAKQNATATLLLSDFYLRGDGVSKSCDQARLLLDAAARKGKSAAGERIRNLQAFGCP
jgi:hypothetical protein